VNGTGNRFSPQLPPRSVPPPRRLSCILFADFTAICLAATLLLVALPRTALGALATQDLTVKTPIDLVNNLIGTGVTVISVTYTGAAVAGGNFTGGTGIIGFEEGIVLGSGRVSYVAGPNISDSKGMANGTLGDSDLTSIVTPLATYDAAVLQFSFIPCGTVVTFEYVFASDEYNEYANGSVNDVFALYVNGVNVALLPGTAIPVSINTVNGGNPYGTGAQNPAYYINNDKSDGGGFINTEMDGLTVVLPANAPVNPGVVNFFKIAISDTGDSIYDSNVFIKKGSFSVGSANLVITKTAPPSVFLGNDLVYTIVVNNNSAMTAPGVLIWDSIPSGVGFLGNDGGGVYDGTKVVWSLGDIPPSSSIYLTLTVSVTGTVIAPNIVMANYVNCSGLPVPPVVSVPVVTVVKLGEPVLAKESFPPSLVMAGGDLTYRVSWSNCLAGTITNLMITDTLPNGTTYKAPSLEFWAPPDWLGTPTLSGAFYSTSLSGPWNPGEPPNGTGPPLFLRWQVDRTVAGSSAQIQFTTQVSATLLDGDKILNQVTATQMFDSKTFSSTLWEVRVVRTGLELNKSADRATVADGGLLTYSIGYGNFSSDTAANITVWDTLPPGAGFVSCSGGTSCGLTGNIVTWHLPTQVIGASGTLGLTVSAYGTAGPPILGPNIAGSACTNILGFAQPEKFSNPVTVPIIPGVPLLDKKAAAGVVAGGRLDYTLSWTNTVDGIVRNMVITDTLPNGTTYKSPSLVFWAQNDWAGTPALVGAAYSPDLAGPWTDGEPPDGTAGPLFLRWTVNRLMPGASGQLGYAVMVSTTLPDGSIIQNGISSTRSLDPSVFGHPEISTRVSQAVLTLNKTPSRWTVPDGSTFSYRIDYANTGSDTAYNFQIIDTVPAGTGYLSCTGGSSCSFDGTKVVWNIPLVYPGNGGFVSFTVSATGIPGTNRAAGYYDNSLPLPRPGIISNPVDITLIPGRPNIWKHASPAGITIWGATISYTVSWSNTVDGIIRDLTITDTLPNGTAYISPSHFFWAQDDWGGTPVLKGNAYATDLAGPWTDGEPPDGASGPLFLRWTVDRVMPGASGQLKFAVKVSATLPEGAEIVNGVSASRFLDPEWIDYPLVQNILMQASVELVKTAQSPLIPETGVETYDIEFRNTGSNSAFNFTVWDTIPAGTSYDSCSGGISCLKTGNIVEWALPMVPPGANGHLFLSVVAGSSVGNNRAAGKAEDSLGNGSSTFSNTASVTVVKPLVLAQKTVSPSSLCSGQPATYTIVSTNYGSGTASGIFAWDTLPSGASYDSCSGAPCSFSGGLVKWTIPPIPAGKSHYVSFKAVPNGPVGPNVGMVSYTNSAGMPYPVVWTNQASISVTSALLNVSLSAAGTIALANHPFSYTITVNNSGNGSAINALASIPVPAGSSWASGGVLVSGKAEWTIPELGPGKSWTDTLVVVPDSNCSPVSLSALASVAYDNFCGTTRPPVSSSPVSTPVQSVGASVAKSADKTRAARGEMVTFTFTLKNDCQEPLTGITLVDTIPPGLAYDSCTGGNLCTETGGNIYWEIPDLGPGGTAVLTMKARMTGDSSPSNRCELWFTGVNSGIRRSAASNPVPITLFVPPVVRLSSCNQEFAVFPNPFDHKSAARGTVKFQGLPADSTVGVYTLRGLKAWSARSDPNCMAEWDGRNQAGTPVAPGVYFWLVEAGKFTDRGRLVVK
jgi:uncharacterized repeat protein (TIGR01451 family)